MASIERIKTECYLIDDAEVEWKVVDARRRSDGRLWEQYPGSDDAELRYFVRYPPPDGANARPATEVRRWRFAIGESRWFTASRWAEQLAAAEIRTGSGS